MHHRNHSHVVFYLPIPRHFLPVTHIISLFHSSPRIVPVPIFKFCPKNRCNVIWHYYTRCLEHWTLVPGFPATSLPTSEPVVEWWADWSAPIPLSSRWTGGDGELLTYCAVSLILRIVIISIFSQGFEKLLKILHRKSDRISLITPGRIYKTSSNHRGPIELRITTHMKTTSSFKLLGVRGCHIF
jgi:hypothetical protein